MTDEERWKQFKNDRRLTHAQGRLLVTVLMGVVHDETIPKNLRKAIQKLHRLHLVKRVTHSYYKVRTYTTNHLQLNMLKKGEIAWEITPIGLVRARPWLSWFGGGFHYRLKNTPSGIFLKAA